MRKLGLFSPHKKKAVYQPKSDEQMTYPGQHVQADVKVVPRKCIGGPQLRPYQYTSIDEFTHLRFLTAYPEPTTYSSADFLKKLFKSTSSVTCPLALRTVYTVYTVLACKKYGPSIRFMVSYPMVDCISHTPLSDLLHSC